MQYPNNNSKPSSEFNSKPNTSEQDKQAVHEHNSSHTLFWLKFLRDRRWSDAQKRHLLNFFNTPELIYQQPTDVLYKTLPGRWRNQNPKITTSWLEADLQWLEQPDQHLICLGDANYPELLKEISDPPLALFCKGDSNILHDPSIAIVGSRRPSPAGKALTHTIAHDLASLGVVITSGMALGIDGSAHQGALQCNGPTVAVMGCGMDTIYPSHHRQLFNDISTTGCIVSEYPLGTPVSKYTFPKRNRIVSGLSHGVLIVEAADKSGTMITARLAMEQNRCVMAVPGSPLSQQYIGSHRLLQQGVALVTCANDILNELCIPLQTACNRIATKPTSSIKSQPQLTHHKLLDYIHHEPTSIDEIISASQLTTAEVSSMLLMLEVENSIALLDNGLYTKLVN